MNNYIFLFPNIDNRPQEKKQKKIEFPKRKGIRPSKCSLIGQFTQLSEIN